MLHTETVQLIEGAVEEVFQRARDRFLGPYSVTGRHLFVGFDRALSLPGIVEQAAIEEGVTPRRDHLESLVAIARNYLDSTEARAKAQVLHEVEAWVREHRDSVEDADGIRNALGQALAEVWGEIKNTMRTIFEAEAHRGKQLTFVEGAMRAAGSLGIEDPTVFFICVHDEKLCVICRKLHLLDGSVVPRVWKLSECNPGYYMKGDERPSLIAIHPNERCQFATLLPGFGFNAAGHVTWKGEGWDEYAHQRGQA